VVPNWGDSPEGNFRVSEGTLDHRLAYTNYWNIDSSADLAKVIPIIV